MNKPIYVVYNNDLYTMVLTPTGELQEVTVRRGNNGSLEEPIELPEIPRPALEQLYGKLLKSASPTRRKPRSRPEPFPDHDLPDPIPDSPSGGSTGEG